MSKFTGPRCIHLGVYARTPMLSVANSDTHAIVCDTAAATPQISPCRLLCVRTLPSKMNCSYCCPIRATYVPRRGKAVCVDILLRSLPNLGLGGKRAGENEVGWGSATPIPHNNTRAIQAVWSKLTEKTGRSILDSV